MNKHFAADHHHISKSQIPNPKSAFTLVELLVVITIIGILIALLLPAVQAAREAARQVQCRNNLKQLALGCLGHESATERFPTGGWGALWTGDADRGNNWRQPGGWIYNILPYIEQESLHEMGAGLATTPKHDAHRQRLSVPMGVLYCPTRRSAATYPWMLSVSMVNALMPTSVARSDYSVNGGDRYTSPASPLQPLWQVYLPTSPAAGPVRITEVENPPGQQTLNARATFSNIAKYATGIIYCGSLIGVADVTDGTSNTYLMGEKYLNPDFYATGGDPGDNESALSGDNEDLARWTAFSESSYLPPQQDTSGVTLRFLFGSAHANGFHMAFCDGSVHMVSYSIDPNIHRWLGNRKDGMAIDGKAF